MRQSLVPENEELRLKELVAMSILDTPFENVFDELTRLASLITGCPMAAITLVDKNRQWFKSQIGLGFKQTPRDVSFCSHAILGDELFLIKDTLLDSRFADNPLVLNSPHIRFYAGFPLMTKNGFKIGTLCVLDSSPKDLSDEQKMMFESLAIHIMNLLEIRLIAQNQKLTKDQLNEAQEISKIGSWNFNLKTRNLVWSRELYKICEINPSCPSDQLLDHYLDIVHPEDLPELEKLIERAEKFGEGYVFNHRALFDQGKRVKHLQGIAKVTFDHNQTPIYLSGTCQDKTSEIELDLKFNALFEIMSEGLVLHNSNGQIIQFNNAALKILNLSEDQLLGRCSLDPSWRAIREDGTDYPGSEHPAMLVLKNKKPIYNIKMGLRFPKSETRWIQINAVPVEFQDGLHALVTFSDISEMVRSYEENQFILDALGIGIWKFNPITKNLIWDSSMYKIFDKDPKEFSSHYEAWENSLTTESKEEAKEALAKALKGEKDFNTTFSIHTRDNQIKYIGGKGKVIRNELGEAVMMYGINWDRTKELELENKLLEERARSLHSAKLATLGELVAGVGHEINNPLAVIKGQLNFLEQKIQSLEIQDDSIVDRIKKIDKAVQRINNIVKGLRIFNPNSNEVQSKFNLKELVQETIEILQEMFSRDMVQLIFSSNNNKSEIIGNRERIQQVLINLISNARDAMEDMDKKEIKISLENNSENFLLSVYDKGYGIDPKIKSKIFDPFFSTKNSSKGSGIGLAIVNTIIKEHKGRIEVESNPQTGTTFKIYFPIARTSLLPEQDSVDKIKLLKKIDAHVVIAEDDDALREVFEIYFGEFFNKVTTFSSAQMVLEFLNNNNVQLIISDIQMPGMSGLDLFKNIIEAHLDNPPQMMLISGGVDIDENLHKLIQEKTRGLIYKPFDEKQILLKLKEIFPEYF